MTALINRMKEFMDENGIPYSSITYLRKSNVILIDAGEQGLLVITVKELIEFGLPKMIERRGFVRG